MPVTHGSSNPLNTLTDDADMAFTGPQPEGTPQTLYKYRHFDPDGHHLGNLARAELWFTSARAFNDPFDSAIEFDLSGLDSPIALRWAVDFLGREFPDLALTERQILAKSKIQQLRDDPGSSEAFKDSHIEENYNRFGICSLTPHRDSLLMWAHYSMDHKGFCFGIDTKKLLEAQLRLASTDDLLDLHRVTYAERMPRISFYESMLSGSGGDDLVRLVTTKSKHWAYENEYRLILPKHVNTSLAIGSDAITEVILGCRIALKDRDLILSQLRGSPSRATIIQAEKGKEKFELIFHEVQ